MINPETTRTALILLLISTLALSCQSSEVTPPVHPMNEPVAIIWDDDGSIDGVTALLYFLEHPLVDVKAATISPGIAHSQVFAPQLAAFLEMQGAQGVAVAAGPEQPLSGDNTFPRDWRSASDRFWDVDFPDVSKPPDERTAAELIVDVLQGSEEQVTIFVSGPLTNLAEAFRIDPSITERIRSVEVMGGALEVNGNVDSSPSAEWNIYIDPVAANEVITSGVAIRLTPLDTTDRIRWTESDAAICSAANRPAGAMAAQLLRYTMNDWSSSLVLVWDLVSVLNVADRGLCQWEQLHVEVVEIAGRNQGQTVIADNKPANIDACLSPDVDAYNASAETVFGGTQ
ncbi:MAG: nucleoside hydrolase [Candidatus Promineifilaceae bacterium]|nr:nucleoside hydrolase [Candidatus Promineifilaceae bacterium]